MRSTLTLFALLVAASASAQTVIKQPTSNQQLAWDQADAETINHYEVQWTSAGAWTTIGKPAILRIVLPVLQVGNYTAKVRSCATANTQYCTPSDALPFTVQPAAQKPSNFRLGPVLALSSLFDLLR